MENASKALIIAGAILISILIVSLGVIIYNNVSGVTSSANLNSTEIAAHNSPFEAYIVNSTSGSNVKALLSLVRSNNATASANDDVVGNYIFVIDGDGKITGTTNKVISSSDIKSGQTYDVSINNSNYADDNPGASATSVTGDTTNAAGYWKNGYIKTIKIVTTTK